MYVCVCLCAGDEGGVGERGVGQGAGERNKVEVKCMSTGKWKRDTNKKNLLGIVSAYKVICL